MMKIVSFFQKKNIPLATLFIVFLLIVSYFLTPSSFAQTSKNVTEQEKETTWQGVEQKAVLFEENIAQDAKNTKHIIADEKENLEELLIKLKKETKEKKATFEILEKEFQILSEKEQAFAKILAKKQSEIDLLNATIRTTTHSFLKYLQESYSPFYTEHLRITEDILAKKHLPSFEDTELLSNALFKELVASGQVQNFLGTWQNSEGTLEKGELTRLGSLGLYARKNEHKYFLQTNNSPYPLLVEGEYKGLAKKLKNSSDSLLPMDFSNGEVFTYFSTKGYIEKTLDAGGFLLWPILLCGFIGLIFSIERFVSLYQIRRIPEFNVKNTLKSLLRGEKDTVLDNLQKEKSSPLQRVYVHILKHSGKSLGSKEMCLHEAILKELPALETRLPTIHVFAIVAPLLGLLGTVTGMINTFEVITLIGTADVKSLSEGISEALITTKLGLMVAIPLSLMHHFLEKTVESITINIEEKGTSLIAVLTKIDN